MKKLILASSSPYKKTLLEKLSLNFISVSPNIDEHPLINEHPRELALRLAIEKAFALQSNYSNHLIISSDQVASCHGQILGKPRNYLNAIKQLTLQSGKKVSFYTSICILDTHSGVYHTDVDVCTTHFKVLSKAQIINYVEADNPFDCAGSFKAEGLGIALFNKISGEDPNALIGLPLIKLIHILNKFSIDVI